MTVRALKPIHPFPARMAPAIVWNRLARGEKGLTVLDPMVGSGTTAATAQYLRHNAIAFDSDPLAVTIARAWCAQVDELEFLQEAIIVLHGAQHRERDFGVAGKDIFQDDETADFAEFWFDPCARRQLAALSAQIRSIKSVSLRSLLWCVFSRMIVTKEAGVSLAMDISHSRPHKVYTSAPITPFDLWPRAVATVAQNKFGQKQRGDDPLPAAIIRRGDARKLPLANDSVDVVVTSPPYLNAIDYLRGHRLSLIWMGFSIPDLRRRRSNNIGSELGFDFKDTDPRFRRAQRAFSCLKNAKTFGTRQRRMIRRYIVDLDAAIGEVNRVLRPEGRAIYVVGDCNLRGLFIENSQIVCSLMQSYGLDRISTRRRQLAQNKRYLPPPCSHKAGTQLRARLGEEVILTFRKP